MDGGTTSFDLAIQHARERYRRWEFLQRRRATQESQCAGVRAEVDGLQRLVYKEERDIDRLQRASLSAIAAWIRDNKEEQLSREQAEAQAAVVRLEGHRLRLAELERGLQATLADLAELDDAPGEFERALQAKEQAVHGTGGPLSAELTRIAGEFGDLMAGLREHDEAVTAGARAEQVAALMLRRLRDASESSSWDMFGGGYFADSVERGQLKGAELLGWQVQQHLDRFAAELRDLGVVIDPTVPAIDTGGFMDMWFDNIFSDWAKHQRIDQSTQAVAQLCDWIRAMVAYVQGERQRLASRADELRLHRERLLSPPA